MLILEIAILWILVIPAAAVAGLSVTGHALTAGAQRRRQVSVQVWTGAQECDDRRARTFTRRPGHRMQRRSHGNTLSRR